VGKGRRSNPKRDTCVKRSGSGGEEGRKNWGKNGFLFLRNPKRKQWNLQPKEVVVNKRMKRKKKV